MKLLWPRRLVSSGSASINAKASQTIGIAQSIVADLGRSLVTAGVALSQAPIRALIQQTSGISLVTLLTGTPANVVQTAAAAISSVASGGTKPSQTAGAELVQVKYDLQQTTYATGQTSSGSWSNAANAVGTNNGTFATNANTLSVAASGNLVLSFASQFNKTDLVISAVTLCLYWKDTAGAVSPAAWKAEVSFDNGANYSTLSAFSTSFDSSVNSQNFDVFASVGQTWSKLTNMLVRFSLVGPASATPTTLSVDAVKLVVTASKTDIL